MFTSVSDLKNTAQLYSGDKFNESSILAKRKRNENEICEYSKSKLLKCSCFTGTENQWKIFYELKCNFVSYSSLLLRNNKDNLNFDYSIFSKKNISTDCNLDSCKKDFNLVLMHAFEFKENINCDNTLNVSKCTVTNKQKSLLQPVHEKKDVILHTENKNSNNKRNLQKALSTSNFCHSVTADKSNVRERDMDLFTTASGKAIHISEEALIASKNFFQDIIDIDKFDDSVSRTKNICKGTSSKLLTKEFDNLNGLLTNNFFRDVSFDEGERESTKKCNFQNNILTNSKFGNRTSNIAERKNESCSSNLLMGESENLNELLNDNFFQDISFDEPETGEIDRNFKESNVSAPLIRFPGQGKRKRSLGYISNMKL